MLKSLELNGFKSFGKKSTVDFTTPVTAVVGPNGSGKSNIVESIRFVLGEQSMKSLRGKGGIDLIFKGSKTTSQGTRASVTITFDNSKKVFAFTNSGLGVSLDFDEIKITREVYADGVNKYIINGSEVRLKDVVDLLASVNIGTSGHHIISQGEADRVLNASSKDRRGMIEDALGLKVYQYRIKESERKLEKTELNIKEVVSLRREIAPHMTFLKKQVEKIEKAQALRTELQELYKGYLFAEGAYISVESKRLHHERRLLDEKILAIEERIAILPTSETEQETNQKEINELNSEAYKLRTTSSDLSRTLGRLEAMLENAKEELDGDNEPEKMISEGEWKSMINMCEVEIDKAIASNDMESTVAILKSLRDSLKTISNNIKGTDNTKKHEVEAKIQTLSVERENILKEVDKLKSEEKAIQDKIKVLEEEDRSRNNTIRDSEKVRYELLQQKNEFTSSLHSLRFEEEKLQVIQNMFETEVQEAGVIVGREAMVYAQEGMRNETNVVTDMPDRASQEDTRRKIERIKIKLEDAGLGNSSEITKEYNDTVERDQFLARELEDLNTSMVSLRALIADLKETLDTEFKTGVEKINKQFQEFFALMFGGGTAFLSVVLEHKKPRKSKDEYDEEDIEGEESEGELQFERGVDINVSLPHKKVRDLHMLSGGERSLTSIALLFAMSQVNPPPFLVLDETDAALDEANSRKYGNMLENLSKYSQLIVVTHNRETMSRAQVLYGVTVGADGVSKLLSIKLDDAKSYAK
jgi:chromosome segregation protein